MKQIALGLILLAVFSLIFGCVQTEKNNLVGAWQTTEEGFPDEFGLRHLEEVNVIFDINETGRMIIGGFVPNEFNYQIVDNNTMRIYVYSYVDNPKWETVSYELIDNNTLVFFNYRLTRKS